MVLGHKGSCLGFRGLGFRGLGFSGGSRIQGFKTGHNCVGGSRIPGFKYFTRE